MIVVTITVEGVNEHPVVTGPSHIDWPETDTGALGTYTATDPEGDDLTQLRLVDKPGTVFAGSTPFTLKINLINGNGELMFLDTYTPDYDKGPRNFEFQVEVREFERTGFTTTYGLTTTYDVRVTLTDVDEPPTITDSQQSGRTEISYEENLRTPLTSYTAVDPEESPVTWLGNLRGDDAGAFSLSDAGELTFKAAPDYDMPADINGDNDYEVTLRARDDGGEIGELDVTVKVTDINEPPTVSGPTTVNYDENGTARCPRTPPKTQREALSIGPRRGRMAASLMSMLTAISASSLPLIARRQRIPAGTTPTTWSCRRRIRILRHLRRGRAR